MGNEHPLGTEPPNPNTTENPGKLWGGRFSRPTALLMETYSASIHYDHRLFRHDLAASRVHCRMLARQGILTQEEALAILGGLDQVEGEISRGEMPFSIALEDIHMHVESRLKELIGPVAGKLHTARSRNDQVATDLRLYLRDECDGLVERIRALQEAFLNQAEEHVETAMPGFTHLQIAQPVTFAHHMLAYFEMLERDQSRLTDLRVRLNQSPLGAAALAATPFPIDREWTARELGFSGPMMNSLDAVSDRDFVLELAFACSVIMVHLSRFAEELILWTTPAFAFVELDDAFTTGSSIMPQKKNPDAAELARGKCGRVIGDLVSLLTLMKGLPLAYNRDMQEDKEAIFDAVDTARQTLEIFAGLLPGMRVHKERLARAAGDGYATATDLADYLVGLGLPFRQAHEVSGRIVRLAVEQGIRLEELSLEEMRGIYPGLGSEVFERVSVAASLQARKVLGGPAPERVRAALQEARKRLER